MRLADAEKLSFTCGKSSVYIAPIGRDAVYKALFDRRNSKMKGSQHVQGNGSLSMHHMTLSANVDNKQSTHLNGGETVSQKGVNCTGVNRYMSLISDLDSKS